MDLSSFTSSCRTADTAIAEASATLGTFVRRVRRSRQELEALSAELHSLRGVLDLLQDDAPAFPETLARQTPPIIDQCTAAVREVKSALHLRAGSAESSLSHWSEHRRRVTELQIVLEGFRMTLGMALDVMTLTREYEAMSVEGLGELDVALADLQLLEAQLRSEPDYRGSFPSLKTYLDSLHAHIEATCPSADASFVRTDRRSTGSSVSDGPDSAIGMGEVTPWKQLATPVREFSSPIEGTFPIAEVDERPYEFEDIPTRPPTPPPRSAARHRQSISLDLTEAPATPMTPTQIDLPDKIFTPVIPKRSASVCGSRSPTKPQEPFVFVTKLASTKPDEAPTQPTTPTAKATRMGRLFGSSGRAGAYAESARITASQPAAKAVPDKRAAPVARRQPARNPMKRLSWIWQAVEHEGREDDPWHRAGLGAVSPAARH